MKIGLVGFKVLLMQKDATNVYPGPEASYRGKWGGPQIIASNAEEFAESFREANRNVGSGGGMGVAGLPVLAHLG